MNEWVPFYSYLKLMISNTHLPPARDPFCRLILPPPVSTVSVSILIQPPTTEPQIEASADSPSLTPPFISNQLQDTSVHTSHSPPTLAVAFLSHSTVSATVTSPATVSLPALVHKQVRSSGLLLRGSSAVPRHPQDPQPWLVLSSHLCPPSCSAAAPNGVPNLNSQRMARSSHGLC